MGIWWKWVVMALLLVGSTASQMALAERDVYRCVYPGGLIEFRGVPVPGLDCVLVDSVRAPASRAASAYEGEGQHTPAARTDGAAEPPSVDDPRARNCEAAQHNLNVLGGGGPVVGTGPDGQPVLIGDDERAAMLRQARRDIEYWCEEP